MGGVGDVVHEGVPKLEEIGAHTLVITVLFIALRLLVKRWVVSALPHPEPPSPDRSGNEIRIAAAALSIVHSVIVVALAGVMAAQVTAHPADPSGEALYVPMHLVVLSGTISIAYFVYDLLFIVLHSKLYSTATLVENFVHHSVVLTMLWINKDTTWYNFMMPVLSFGEVSTIALNIRQIYRLLNRSELWVSALFAVTFFVSRVVVLGWGVAHLFSDVGGVQARLTPILQVSFLGLLPALYCLNLYWFYAVCISVRKVLFKKAGRDKKKSN
jgi:hypothetical protein